MARAWLTPAEIGPAIPLMQRRGVSKVARSSRGFLTAYLRAGSADRLSAAWRTRREAFIARHMAQVRQRSEPLWRAGAPTRRHLALVAWAYTPDRARWLRWLDRATEEGSMPRQNPGVQHAEDVYTSTHWGVYPDALIELADPDLPDHLVEMGKLREIRIHQGRGAGSVVITYSADPRCVLAFDPRPSRRLYVVVPPSVCLRTLGEFDRADGWTCLRKLNRERGGRQARWTTPAIDVVKLGRWTHVVYATHKRGDGPSEYVHRMGEEGGREPWLCMDREGRLWAAGGSYDVKDDGIVR